MKLEIIITINIKDKAIIKLTTISFKSQMSVEDKYNCVPIRIIHDFY